MNKKNEKTGDFFMLGEVLLWSIFPILLANSNGIPPIFFAAVSNIVAGIVLFFILLFWKRKDFIFPKESYKPAFLGIFIIIFLLYPPFFIAGQHTSAGNLALLWQIEVVFSFLFFVVRGKERSSFKRLLGTVIVLFGASLILFQGFSGIINIWDMVIVAALLLAPIGNEYQKQTVQKAPALGYAMYRSVIGGILLLGISAIYEPHAFGQSFEKKEFFIIAISGILCFGLSKWFWLEGIKRVGVTKAISMNAAIPSITLFLSFIFLSDIPQNIQIVGAIATLIGVPLILSQIPELIFIGKTKTGDGMGRKIGFPTINIETTDKTPKGVYAAYAEINGEKYKGMVHCGPRPSFGKIEWRTEIHFFDFALPLAEGVGGGRKKEIPENTPITLLIEKRIRRVKKFSSVEKLQQALQQDKKTAEEFFQKKVSLK